VLCCFRSASLAVPDMSKQRGAFEKDNLKLHLCNAVFEAYSASYLTTKQHMLNGELLSLSLSHTLTHSHTHCSRSCSVASESFNLSWVNCEMASFIHMKESNRFFNNPNSEGPIMQSLDVLDFSAIHLSAFERSSKKHRNAIWESPMDRKTKWTDIKPVVEAGHQLAALNAPGSATARKLHYSREALRTVVIMPFLGGAMGAGHSELNNRFEYLKTCFWSLYEFFPFITMGVSREQDVEWAM
jgi:hypothetical protein